MIWIEQQQLAELLPYPELADALKAAFVQGGMAPARQRYTVPGAGGTRTHLLLMPAWQEDKKIGVKVATVSPANASRGLAAVNATYLLLDANTGVPEVILDGTELTRRRTAAASILAARHLARPDSKVLLVVGTGQMAAHLINAYCADRRLETVLIWGRRHDQSLKLAQTFAGHAFSVEAVQDLEATLPSADIISCATLSQDALLFGKWLTPGQHLDLVGSFTPAMREVDDAALQRADLYVDTREGALREAGELVQAMRNGSISESDVKGDLFDLARGTCTGRSSAESITLFKSVGTGLEDLAAARMAVGRFHPGG